MIRYRMRIGDGPWAGDVSYRAVMRRARKALRRRPGPYRDLWPWDSGEFNDPMGRPRIMLRLSKRLRSSRFLDGDVVTILCSNAVRIRIGKVETSEPAGPPIVAPGWSAYPNEQWNSDVQRINAVAYGFDPSLRCNGAAWSRVIAGTSTWSQHSRWRADGCRGNAADTYYALPPPVGVDMAKLDDLEDHLVATAKAGLHPMTKLIFRQHAWQKIAGVWFKRPYFGRYHTHHHWEGPERSGEVCR